VHDVDHEWQVYVCVEFFFLKTGVFVQARVAGMMLGCVWFVGSKRWMWLPPTTCLGLATFSVWLSGLEMWLTIVRFVFGLRDVQWLR
jgi:hypothetical protein